MPFTIEIPCDCCGSTSPDPCQCPNCNGVDVAIFHVVINPDYSGDCSDCITWFTEGYGIIIANGTEFDVPTSAGSFGCEWTLYGTWPSDSSGFPGPNNSLIRIQLATPYTEGTVQNFRLVFQIAWDFYPCSNPTILYYDSEDFTCATGGTFTFSSGTTGFGDDPITCGGTITVTPVSVTYCKFCCQSSIPLPSEMHLNFSNITGEFCGPPYLGSDYTLTQGTFGVWTYSDSDFTFTLDCHVGYWTLTVHSSHGDDTPSSDVVVTCSPFLLQWTGALLSGLGCTVDIMITEV